MKKKQHVFVVGKFMFMRHPTVRGAWIRTDASVALADCPHCGALKGRLCVGKNTPDGCVGTHYARRFTANMWRNRERARLKKTTTIVYMETM